LPARADDLVPIRAVFVLLAVLTLARLVVNAWADPLPLSGDEAQYWLYGEHLAGGYYSKPPLLPWLMRASTEVFGDAHWAMRLPSVVLHGAIAFVLFLLGRELFGQTVGVVAALVYLTLPAVSVSSMIASTDPPMMLGWALASLALVLALRSESLVPWALTGAAVGLGLLGKYTMLAWVVAAAIVLLLDPYWRRGVRLRGLQAAGLALLVVASPNLVWNAWAGFPTVRHLGENADLAAGEAVPLSERAAELGDFVVSQIGVFGPIAFAVLLWLLMRPATWRDPALRYVLALGLPLLVAIAVQAWLNRANANWAAPAYLGFSVAVAAWLVTEHRRRLTIALTVLHVAVFGLIVAAAVLHRDEPSTWSRSFDPFRKLRGVDQAAAAVAPVLAAHPEAWLLMTDRMLLANILEGTGWPLDRAIMWNPDGEVENHFDMVTAFPGDPAATFVVVLEASQPPTWLDRFAAHEEVVVVPIATHADATWPLRVDLARGFRGYGP
jgi:4-amino-4-deoxy-L-arabinose transferase-like glycosyltransferase